MPSDAPLSTPSRHHTPLSLLIRLPVHSILDVFLCLVSHLELFHLFPSRSPSLAVFLSLLVTPRSLTLSLFSLLPSLLHDGHESLYRTLLKKESESKRRSSSTPSWYRDLEASWLQVCNRITTSWNMSLRIASSGTMTRIQRSTDTA